MTKFKRVCYSDTLTMLKDKIALITGASSGIGYATALALSKAGAKVALGARRTDRLESLKKQITSNGGEVLIHKLDVTKKEQCDSFVDAVIKSWKTVDILINNAGIMPLSFFKNLKVSEWDQMIDVNIKGVIYCTAAVIQEMICRHLLVLQFLILFLMFLQCLEFFLKHLFRFVKAGSHHRNILQPKYFLYHLSWTQVIAPMTMPG